MGTGGGEPGSGPQLLRWRYVCTVQLWKRGGGGLAFLVSALFHIRWDGIDSVSVSCCTEDVL